MLVAGRAGARQVGEVRGVTFVGGFDFAQLPALGLPEVRGMAEGC